MGYDEQWSTSPVSGPNASIGFVRYAVANTLREVPPDKLILGIPFYVRVWREETGDDGAVSVTSRSYSMDRAYRQFVDNGAVFEWDDETAHYYAEYTAAEGGRDTLYRVWLEEERSMEEKLKAADINGLAGVASWRRGLEKENVWGLIYRYMKE
jgi:spore germination protein YaaH